MRDLYSVLNLSRRASSTDIKSAYRALAKQFHPDVNAGDKEAEGWTKEINRAYEILGDCDARAVYDLDLARRRTKVRRSFLRGATAGVAAALIVAAASIAIAPVWKHHALQTRRINNEMVAANAPAQERAPLKSAPSEHLEASANRGEPVSAPLTRPPNELPGSTRSKMTSTAPSDWAERTPYAPAPSPAATDRAPREAQPATAPSEPSRTEMPKGQQPLPQAPDPPAPRTELANIASPEVKNPGPTPVAQEPGSEPRRPDGHRKPEAADKKPKKRLKAPRIAAATQPNKLQGSEGEPRLVSSRATALRWPSADEPFVNVGARHR